MLQYVCIITNENESMNDNFIHSISFHTSYDEANTFADKYIKTLSGMSDFFIYRNLDKETDVFLNQNTENSLPF